MTELSGDTTSTAAGSDATPAAAAAASEAPASDAPAAETAEALRPGVPVWRVGKPDAFLAADIAAAYKAVLSIATAEDVGVHVGARSEGVRCVTHLFESKKPGYRGWVWFATLSRISRGKESTVNEVGLLPTEDSVLAPAWVPWSERVRPEDREDAATQAHGDNHDGQNDGGSHPEHDGHDHDGSDGDSHEDEHSTNSDGGDDGDQQSPAAEAADSDDVNSDDAGN